ncbi:T9SS sorting signal type C domain-containing protein [Flavobacterium sp.]|uniref:T9SS sorting signal type C domain-containing protein n=1 Tax=Flavobacterium sp. TaxID=239 RepID=UPI003C5B3FFD
MNKFYTKNTVPTVTKIQSLFIFICLMLVSTSFGQTTLFQFNFENTTNPNIDNVNGTPSFSSSGVTGTGFETNTPCQGARMYHGKNWDTGEYFRFEANTTGYGNMSFSFCNRTSSTSIGNFIVRVSSNSGSTWDTVLTSFTPTTSNTTLYTATFPISTNNTSSVWIDIYKTDNPNNGIEYYIDSATLTGYSIPIITSFTGSPSCSNAGTSVVINGTNFSGATAVKFNGVNASSFTVNSSTKITAILPPSATTGAISITSPNGTANSSTDFIINSAPNPIATASPTTIISGGNTTLSVSTTPTVQNTILLSDDFNSGTNWKKINNSTGGNPVNAVWTIQPDGYYYKYGSYTGNTFHSNDNSSFYISNSADQGNGNTNTILRSPSISTMGYTSLSLDFYQFIREFDNTNFSYVEVSTDDLNWNTLATYDTNGGDEGADNNFAHKVINLNAYINKPILYIRFRYVAQFDWFWAIDNVTISGNKTIDYTYNWTASPSGTAGLPSGSGTPSTSNNSIVANPTANTAYTVTATNPDTGCTETSIVNVSVCPSSAGTLSGNQYLCTYGLLSDTYTSTISGGTWSSSNTGVATVNSTTGLVTAMGAGTATITYTLSNSGCTTRTATRTVYVANGPGGGVTSITGSNSQCQGTTANYSIISNNANYNHTWSYSGSGVTFVVSADGRSATATYDANATSGNVTVHSTNACGSNYGNNLYVTVAPSSNGGTIPSSASGCANTYITYLNLTGNIGNPIRWESSNDNFVSNVVSISNTNNGYNVSGLTQTTYYRAVVQNAPCTNIGYSNICTVTIINNTVSTASSSPNVCSNTAIPNITHTTTGATGIGTATGLPAGVTANFSSNTITISGTPTAFGTFNYSIPLTGGCGTVNATGTIIVKSNSTIVLTSGTQNPTVCAGSAITNTVYTFGGSATGATVSGLPSGLSSTVSGNKITISGTPTTSGTYTISTTGHTSPCNTATISGTVTRNLASTIVLTSGTQNPTVCAGSAITNTVYTFGGSATGATVSGLPLGLSSTVSGSTITISGTPTTNGTYTISTTGHISPCSAATISGTVTRNLASTIVLTSGTQNPTVCAGSAITNTVYTFGGSATGATVSGLPSGLSSTVSGSTITISGTPTTSGTYTISTTGHTSPCSAISLGGTITVSPVPTIPTVVSITQPDCKTPTGSVTLSGLPSGNWTVNPGGITGSTTTATITGLAVGTHNLTVTNSNNCPSPATADIVINPVVTNTWTTSWSNGTPTSAQAIVFNGDYSSTGNIDIEGCSCIVNAGKNVVFNSGHTLKITNGITVSGSLTFENGASLVQISNTATNSGNIIYKRNTTSILNTDYVYWSSPVTGANLGAIQTGTIYSSFNASSNKWVKASAGTGMNSGIGYIVRGAGTSPVSGTPFIKTATFIGTPNNGIIPVSIVGGDASNLIGNPYPSAVNADAFLYANSSVLEGTLYFWTHSTAIQLAANITNGSQGTGKYAYTSDDYATYNFTGGTIGVGQLIAAGQGFFAQGGSGGTATFDNSMRLNPSGGILDNSQFSKPTSGSKTAKTSTTINLEKNRIWLNLTNTEGAFKQMLIGYITGATNKYDRGYDGASFDGNSFVDFYSINENTPLTIQGRALPFEKTDIIPLGYTSTINGDFTIAIDKTDGFLANQEVFLEDKSTGIFTNLKKGSYTFATQKGIYNDRFVISYVAKTSLDNDNFVTNENSLVVFHKDNKITVQSSDKSISKVQLYDVSGKLILEKSKINTNEAILSYLHSVEQVLIVKVTFENGHVISKKIIY